MLPSLIGIIASSGGAVGGDYESISTVTVGSGGASTITFSSIPSTYQHLQIRGITRNGITGTGIEISQMRFNSDSGNNYARHRVGGNGSSASATSATSASSVWVCAMYIAGELANTFGTAVVDVLDYANTSKYKTVRSLEGLDDNNNGASGEISLRSGLWMNTSAITSITFTPTGGTYAQYSQFALYGIKG